MSKLSIAHLIEEFYPEYYLWCEYPAEECVCIRSVKDEWGVLCNFGDTPLTLNGVTFRNAEQLFQMMKFRDPVVLQDIYSANGQTIKMKAKKYMRADMAREDWGSMIVDAMKFCLQTKYNQRPEFKEALAQTSGKIIVEDQTTFPKKTADTWGAKRKEDKFIGPNLLGRLLMELRDNGRLEYVLPDDALDFTALIS